ncbi:hypothetical protein ACVCAH_04595 [Micromonospora sp. LZ34]
MATCHEDGISDRYAFSGGIHLYDVTHVISGASTHSVRPVTKGGRTILLHPLVS